MQISDNHVSIYASYELITINSDHKHWYVLIHIHVICPEQICLPHQIYVLLLCYCSLHMDPTLLDTQVQQQETAALIL